MRIGVNTLFLIPGEVGGTETYLRQTLKAMAANAAGHALVLFTNSENDAVLKADLAAYPWVRSVCLNFRAGNRFSRIVREQVQLPLAVRRAGVDVLWSPGYTAPFCAPCPQVTTVPDMQYKTHPEDLTWLALLTTALLVPMAVRRSRRVLAISDFSRAEIVKYTGAHPGKIRVTPLAADELSGARMDAATAKERASPLIGSAAPYLLVMANTYPHKNAAAAVAAFGRLQSRIRHTLVLVGQPRRGEAAVLAAVAGLPDRTRFTRLDWVAREDLGLLCRGADVLVHPSLYEGFGLPVLEAMMAGIPVVTGLFGAIPEVGGDACVYVDSRSPEALAAGIAEVLAWDGATRSRRVAQARLHAAGFSWRRTAELTMAALVEAAQTAGSEGS